MKLLPAIEMQKKFWILLYSGLVVGWLSLNIAIVGDTVIIIERATSPQEHARGLSGRTSMGERKGLLFIFEEKRNPQFWMKGMEFPIDIIWIADGQVVALDEGAKVAPHGNDEEITRYTAPVPIDRVLEVKAGNAKKWGISVGTRVYVW